MNSLTIEAVKKNLDISQNVPLKTSVYEAFKKTIVLGDIPAGQRINEKEFSDVLNISRTPIRFALKELEKEKLVAHLPRIGVVVKGISQKDAVEIFEIRKSLDTLASIQAMEKMTDEDFHEMDLLLQRGEEDSRNDRIDDVLQNFTDFNAFIYQKSQMVRLTAIVTQLQAYLFYFRDISIRSSKRRQIALDEHRLIYRGMKNKNIEQITLITHEHLDRSLIFILSEMERRQID